MFRKKESLPVEIFEAGKMEESEIIGEIPNSDSVVTVKEQQKPTIDNLPIE